MAAFCNKIDLIPSKLKSQKQNPLRIDVILDLILGKLPIAQLKKCRRVNRQWDSRACHFLKKSWKKLKFIELEEDGKNVKFAEATHKANDKGLFCKFEESLQNYTEFSNSIFEIHPTKCLQLKLNPCFSFQEQSTETKIEDILNILRVSSKSLEELHLITMFRSGRIISPTQSKTEGWLDFNLLQLEKIVVCLNCMSDLDQVENYKAIFLLLDEIKKRAPKLKSLEITDNYNISKYTNTSVLDYLKNSEILRNLENLGIIFKFAIKSEMDPTLIGPKNLMELLHQANGLTNLKSLKLKINIPYQENFESEFVHLTRFLESLAEKLEFLEIDIAIDQLDIESIFQISLPKFTSLKKIIMGNIGTNHISSIPFATTIPFFLDLSTKFPVLKEISLVYNFPAGFNFQSWDTLFTGSSETVEMFRLEYGYKNDAKMHFKALERKFPNVRQFQTIGIDDLFKNEGENPWEATLEVFTFISESVGFRKLDFKLFQPYKALQRIEVLNRHDERFTLNEYNHSSDSKVLLKFDLDILLELKIKSLKIHHFFISEKDAAKIREKLILDYTLCRRAIKKQRNSTK